MRNHFYQRLFVFIPVLSLLLTCCHHQDAGRPSAAAIAQLNLKRGPAIACGPPDTKLGLVNFPINSTNNQIDFNLAVALLHSFEYDEAEKIFTKIIDADPDCAMAYWGVAMCNFHPLWTPPTDAELQKGSRAAAIATAIYGKPEKESDYIRAISSFYSGWQQSDHYTRCVRYEKAMAKVYAAHPEDKEAAIFYALALDASAKPTDQTFSNQRKAGGILNALYPGNPEHPGIIHYIIHTFDYPGLAQTALPAARRYALIAPSSAHALHMPSHIFTRLGLWNECVSSNLSSLASAKCYAEQSQMHGHWAEELHAMDYLAYAYLQKGDDQMAEEQLNDLLAIKTVYPSDLKVAYAFASIPARVSLEDKNWKRAAGMRIYPETMSWEKYPWQESIFYFARLLGSVHLEQKTAADAALDSLETRFAELKKMGDGYKAKEVEIQCTTGRAWIDFAFGSKDKALGEMKQAADMEDSTQKHPVTPGEVLPARELFGDMLREAGRYDSALRVYETALQRSPNRFNSLFGAGQAAQKAGDHLNATKYYRQLMTTVDTAGCTRAELGVAKAFLNLNR